MKIDCPQLGRGFVLRKTSVVLTRPHAVRVTTSTHVRPTTPPLPTPVVCSVRRCSSFDISPAVWRSSTGSATQTPLDRRTANWSSPESTLARLHHRRTEHDIGGVSSFDALKQQNINRCYISLNSCNITNTRGLCAHPVLISFQSSITA